MKFLATPLDCMHFDYVINEARRRWPMAGDVVWHSLDDTGDLSTHAPLN